MGKTYFRQESEFGASVWYEENGHRISFGETPGNRHYEEYLEWLAEGNEPEVIEPEVASETT
jgi:hypothetical protein